MTGALYSAAGVASEPETGDAALVATVADGGMAALVLRDDDGWARITWVNAAACELLGVPESGLLDRPVLPDPAGQLHDLPHWTSVLTEQLDPAADHWHNASTDVHGGSLATIQLRVRTPAPGRHVVWLRPATPAVQLAQEAQAESEHRFRSLAEHAPVGIVLSEAGVRLGFVNDRFAEIAGMEIAKLTGTGWLQVIHPEDLPALLEILDEVLSGSAVETTVRMLSVVNSQRWVQIRLSPVTTPRRSAGFIGTVEDITARHAWESQLTYQAGHDALTGLANRRNLVETLTDLICSRRSRDRDAAVLFCDLDGFKRVNDTLGHDAGDRVLIEVGQRLSSTARDEDLVARIAGDEFVVLIRGIGSYADAEAAAVRQLRALAPQIRVAGEVVTVSASIGIAMARDYDSAALLLQAADRGMYEAKRAGAGNYRPGLAAGPERRQS